MTVQFIYFRSAQIVVMIFHLYCLLLTEGRILLLQQLLITWLTMQLLQHITGQELWKQGKTFRIELPQMGASEGDHTFTVSIQSINGGTDALATNNTRTNDFSFEPIEDELIFDTETVTITVQTDDAASEITWLLWIQIKIL